MTDIRFLGPDTDAFVESVQRHAREFEDRTGLNLDLRIVESDLYFSNRIHPFLAGDDPADVYMSGPVLLWEHVGAGLVEPLDAYLAGSDAAYDARDLIDNLLAANRWSGRFRDPLGDGPLLELPVNCESYNLAYAPQILERAGVGVPTTWREYFETALLVAHRAGGPVRGFAQRGLQVWHTMYTGYATQFWSYGARDFDTDGRCSIASEAGIHATQDFIDALRIAGPSDWLDQRWYELALDFAAGRYGLIVDSDHYVAYFEDANKSAMAGKIGYAPPPQGPGGSVTPNLWTWSLVMNSRSPRKDAAWRFIEWASGREFLLRSAFEGNMNPTRTSIWDDERFIEFTRPWDDYYRVSRDLIEQRARVLVTPASDYLAIGDRWVRALREAYAGMRATAEALTDASSAIDELIAAS
jgi:multiple sugar transport system substrate-binding protein